MFSKLLSLSRWRLLLAAAVLLLGCMTPLIVQAAGVAAEEAPSYSPPLYGTFWSLVPPLVAIILALVTKEVFSSLFLGIVIGGIFFATGPNPAVYDEAGEAVWESSNAFTGTFNHIIRDGFLTTLTDGWNIGIVIFLCVLGMIVAMMAKVGGSKAFGDWASRRIKTRVGAQLALMLFHLFIFIDDYFACLTVGSVMRPVTDRAKVSRAKLAYLIDGTAAPICILAPISTWAAAVASYIPEEGAGSDINGFTMFIKAIPWNFYAILTIVMILTLVLLKFDFGPMAKHEVNAELKGDLFTTGAGDYLNDTDSFEAKKEVEEIEKEVAAEKGKVYDLVVPIAVLIVSCVLGLIYTGGFFSGGDAHLNFVESFSGSDAATGLVIGSIFSITIIIIYYIIRRLMSVRELTEVIPKGIHAMASPILILSFAWTLKAMTDTMGSSEFVSSALEGPAQSLQNFLPAIVFLVAAAIAFSTGTSWGTYGIVVPIVAAVFAGVDNELLVIGIAACLAGGVMGDHCSPISDTTIMASAGAQCNHINHVNTQLPYALTVAGFSFVMYLIGGFVRNAFIMLPLAIVLFVGLLFIIRKLFGKTVDRSQIATE